MTAQARFQEVGESLSSRLWDIEQFSYDTFGALGGATVQLQTVNLETFQRLGAVAQSLNFILGDDPLGGRSIRADMLANFPLFLGAPRIQELSAGFDILTIDGGVGERSNMLLSGYYWGPAARNAPGGPQRPLTGLFGQ